MRIFKQTWFDC